MTSQIRYYVAASIPAWQEFARGAITRGETLKHFLAGVHPANQTNARNAFLSVAPMTANETQVATMWRQLPSVSREGKFFYRRGHGAAAVTVMQSWVTNAWSITRGGRMIGAFRSARIAMDFADSTA